MNQPNTGSPRDNDQTTPRLFRLRDLHPTTNAAPATQPIPEQVAPAVQANQAEKRSGDDWVAGHGHQANPQLRDDDAGYDSGPFGGNDVDSEEASEEELRTRERIERHLDVSPEGRSWMESALAHRKVLVLLVLAISAAFWTSRGDQAREKTNPDSELAQGNGTLEFDPSQFNAGTLVEEGQEFFPSESNGGSNTQDLVANSDEPAVNSSTTNSITQTKRSPDSGAAGHNHGQSAGLASNLLTPKPINNAAVSGAPSGSQNPPSRDNAVAVTQVPPSSVSNNDLARPQTHANGLSVEAVSSRTPRDPVFYAPSSLDTPSTDGMERPEMDAVAGGAVTQRETELTLQKSSTPNSVTDWLKYLPSKP